MTWPADVATGHWFTLKLMTCLTLSNQLLNDLTNWITGDFISRLQSSSDGPVHSAATVFKMFHLIMNLWSEPFSCLFIPDRNKHWKLSRNPDHFSFSFLLGSQYIKLGERSRGGGHNSISTILLIVSFMWVQVCVLCVCVCGIESSNNSRLSESLLWASPLAIFNSSMFYILLHTDHMSLVSYSLVMSHTMSYSECLKIQIMLCKRGIFRVYRYRDQYSPHINSCVVLACAPPL